jgi:hypothetical protein
MEPKRLLCTVVSAAVVGYLLLSLAKSSEVAEGQSPISVAIAIPASSADGGSRMVRTGQKDAHFHVVLTNVSNQPQRIWREDCSWGYSALSFEFTDELGKTFVAKKMPRAWMANAPFYWTLAPHEPLVLDVYFTNAAVWSGFPQPQPHKQETFSVKAIFEVKPDAESQQSGVWTGRLASQPENFKFVP